MNKLLHHIFERQCLATPSALAVKSQGREFTYLEIEEKANRLARYLRANGLRAGDFVGICFTRSELPILAMLGILKAGGVYVPIERSFPEERIRHIVDDARIQHLLTEQGLAAELSGFGDGRLSVFDITSPDIAGFPCSRLDEAELGLTPDDLCYVIYTSGTTGRPKGVMTQHRNVVHFVESFRQVCGLTGADRLYNGFAYSFDGSVEEIWMAFSNGASLIVATDEMTRVASEAARLIEEEGVTFLSTVPTFLGMIEQPLPTVRLVILSGEVCPRALIDKWVVDGRRVLNVYGPTETTVNTTAWECVPGEAVKIGTPLPGYDCYILDEGYRPVGAGARGELYVGGGGLARGYLNQEDQTRQTFLEGLLDDRRLYRTGDLVSMTEAGELLFHGRIDSQVKIRGYRIELSEIEVVLREHPSVYASAVTVTEKGMLRELAAYVVLEDGAEGLAGDEVLKLLRKRLPVYMIPAYLELIEELPRLASGKVNKQALPVPETPLISENRPCKPPETELQASLVGVWKEVFGIETVSIDDHFFNDLGGHSLLAAKAVSLLRHRYSMDVAIREVYTHPTIRELAAAIERRNRNTQEKHPRNDREQVGTHRLSGWIKALQGLSLYLLYGVLVLPITALVVFFLRSAEADVSVGLLLGASLGLAVLGYPGLLLISVVSKWLILGRTRAGVYPLYGWYYWRWWLADRIQAITGAQLLAGSPLMSVYFRLMGARIGRNCVLDTHLCSAFDMLSIGDDTCIGNETQLMGCTVQDGFLKIGKVTIGRNCYVGIHSYVGIDTVMGDNCRLGDVSALHDGQTLYDNASRQGSPAVSTPVKVPRGDAYVRRPLLWGFVHVLALLGLLSFMFATGVPSLLLVSYGLYAPSLAVQLLSVVAAGPLIVLSFCVLAVLVKKLIFRRVSPGTYRVESLFFVRKWLMDGIMRISVVFLKPLYTTIYLPAWLRMLGADMGRRAEISTVSQISPELMVIGDESFFADASIIGGRHFHQGYMEVSETRIGKRSFVGNVSILPVGTSIGDNCLLGVLSVPPITEGTIPNNTDWLGSPSFNLPRRQILSGFDDTVIYRPTLKLFVQRYLIDGLRIFIPFTLEVLGILTTVYSAYFLYDLFGLAAMLGLMPLVALVLAVASALAVVAVKWSLIGRIAPTIKPLWSTFVWFNEAVNGAYESVATTILLPLLGTPFFAPLLRMMGAEIGKNVYIGSTLFSEFDLVHIGDNVAINTGVIVQNHLFEDRIMKASSLYIQDDCDVGNLSVVLYDAVLGKGASLNALSLAMKGENLPEHTDWEGIPCQPRSAGVPGGEVLLKRAV